MTSERAFLIAPVEALLIAEPTVESRAITDADLADIAQTIVDASADLPGYEINLERSNAIISELLAGSNGEPRRDAWLGIWEGSGPPVALVLCTTWRGMPYIAAITSMPTVRNRGYASSLVREAAAIFWSKGDSHVGIALDAGSPSQHLFNELGFKEMFSAA